MAARVGAARPADDGVTRAEECSQPIAQFSGKGHAWFNRPKQQQGRNNWKLLASSYELKVLAYGVSKELSWSQEHCELTKDAQALTELVREIHGMVEQKAEYKQLPEPSGGYE